MERLKRHSFLFVSLITVAVCSAVTAASRYTAEMESIPTDATAIIYTHEDPVTVLNGTSPCVPCNRLVADLLKNYKIKDSGQRIVGTGPNSIFRVVKAPPQIKFTPLIVYYYNNGKKDWISGYEGDYRAVALKHPAFGGKGGARSTGNLHLSSNEASGFAPRRSPSIQTLTFKGDPQPTDQNETPFIPDSPYIETPEPQVDGSNADIQLVQCGLFGQMFGAQSCAASYSQSCAASSYYAPFSSCNGGGGVGGGGDFYNPSAYYGQPYYQRPVMPAYRQPTYQYAVPSYGYQTHRPYAGRMVCGPNGCYYVN